MILVDTSVWVDYLRRGNEVLAALLAKHQILSHPFVVGELALGGITAETLESLRRLPQATISYDDEVLGFIARYRLAGRGIGYVDAHLISSARLTVDANLWTLDQSLRAVVHHLGMATAFDH